jgi:hypothetical protein
MSQSAAAEHTIRIRGLPYGFEEHVFRAIGMPTETRGHGTQKSAAKSE